MLRLHALNAFADNYIWALVADDGRALVVDPGDARPVLDAAAAGLRPVAILLTHHHADHVGGAQALQQAFGARCFAPHDERIAQADVRVGDGDRVDVAELGAGFDVLAVPGHTRSHVAFHGEGRLFCGDTLFSLGCGRLFEGTPAQMLDSLERLATLPEATEVCCGHEYTLANAQFALAVDPANPVLRTRHAQAQALRAEGRPTLPSRLGDERAANPFLRSDAPSIRDALRARDGEAPRDRVAAFASLRAWKDGFRAA